MGRPLATLVLSDEEQQELQALARRRKTAQALALRARIVLAAASGKSNTEVAEELQLSLATVGKWRKRYVEQRMDGCTMSHVPENREQLPMSRWPKW